MATNVYVCDKCGAQVTKTPLVASKDWNNKKDSGPKASKPGLGKWHCNCGNNKVKVQSNK